MFEYNNSPYTYFMYDDGSVHRIDKTGDIKFILKDKTVRSIITQAKHTFILNSEGVMYMNDNKDPILIHQHRDIYKIRCTSKRILILYRSMNISYITIGKIFEEHMLTLEGNSTVKFRDIFTYDNLMILIDIHNNIYYHGSIRSSDSWQRKTYGNDNSIQFITQRNDLFGMIGIKDVLYTMHYYNAYYVKKWLTIGPKTPKKDKILISDSAYESDGSTLYYNNDRQWIDYSTNKVSKLPQECIRKIICQGYILILFQNHILVESKRGKFLCNILLDTDKELTYLGSHFIRHFDPNDFPFMIQPIKDMIMAFLQCLNRKGLRIPKYLKFKIFSYLN
jgi:hypothetical protein